MMSDDVMMQLSVEKTGSVSEIKRDKRKEKQPSKSSEKQSSLIKQNKQ